MRNSLWSLANAAFYGLLVAAACFCAIVLTPGSGATSTVLISAGLFSLFAGAGAAFIVFISNQTDISTDS